MKDPVEVSVMGVRMTGTPHQSTIVMCYSEAIGWIVFSIDFGEEGPWNDASLPIEEKTIMVTGLVPAKGGFWVPTSAYPVPTQPPTDETLPATIGLGRDV